MQLRTGLLLLLMLPSVSAAADGGFTGAAPANAIPLTSATRVTPGPPGCPAILVDRQVYDLHTLQRIGPPPEAPPPPAPGGRRGAAPQPFAIFNYSPALSANAKRFAEANDQTKLIVVTDVATGAKTNIPFTENHIRYLGFAGDDLLLIAAGENNQPITLWDLTANKVLRTIATKPFSEDRQVAISKSGHYLAVATVGVTVYDTRTGKPAAVMENPAEAGPIPLREFSAIAFSDDTRELAAVSWNGLVIWNNHGEVASYFPMVPAATTLSWLPDHSGLLLNGTDLYDRSIKRLVARRYATSLIPAGVVVSKDAFLAVSVHNDVPVLNLLPLGLDDIHRRVAAAANPPRTALIRDGAVLDAEFKLDGLKDYSLDLDLYTLALTNTLKNYNMRLSPTAPIKLIVTYSEAPGTMYPDEPRAEAGGITTHGNVQGPPIPTTIANLDLTLVDGSGRTLWQMPPGLPNFSVPLDKVDPAGARKMLARNFTGSLMNSPLPTFFVPDAPDLTLPVLLPQ